MKPLIGYRNIGRNANAFSAPDVANLFSGLTYDGWQSGFGGFQTLSFTTSNQSANYFAVANHNLSGTVQLYVNGVLRGQKLVTSNSPFIATFGQVTGTSWELRINQATPAYLNILNVGRILELERGVWNGHAPMTLNRSNRYINNMSDSGQLLGRKLISEGATGQISIANLSSDWVRDEWDLFTNDAERYGFFWQHNPSQYPDEVAYCWTTGDPRVTNSGVGGVDNKGRMSAELSVRGIV